MPENPIALRLPPELLKRADKMVKQLSKDPEFINIRTSRNYVLKMAILRGLEVMEADPSKAK
jgi:hypothetical protein